MAIRYKTTKAFSKKGGIIPTGGTITSSHPRFDEGLRKGWIVKVGRDAKSKTSLPFSPKETKPLPLEPAPKLIERASDTEDGSTIPTLGEVVETTLETGESGDPGFEISGTVSGTETANSTINSETIDEIEFLSRHDEAALLEKGIMQVSDFKGWNVEQLMVIRGIGKSKATKLMDAYDEWEKSRITEEF